MTVYMNARMSENKSRDSRKYYFAVVCVILCMFVYKIVFHFTTFLSIPNILTSIWGGQHRVTYNDIKGE